MNRPRVKQGALRDCKKLTLFSKHITTHVPCQPVRNEAVAVSIAGSRSGGGAVESRQLRVVSGGAVESRQLGVVSGYQWWCRGVRPLRKVRTQT